MALASLIVSFAAKGQPPPFHLRCDLLPHTATVYKSGIPDSTAPERAVQEKNLYLFAKILSEKPLLSWETDSALPVTTAYQILVASSRQLLNQDKGDYWDSKKVPSRSSRATYSGKSLLPGKVYYWKVRVWDEKNRKTPFSQGTSFVTAQKDEKDTFSYHPLAAQIQEPQQINQTGPNSYFLDFGKDALSQLQLQLNSSQADTIWIEVGELTDKPFSIDKNPGRNIRYLKIPLLLKKGTHNYQIQWPENVKRNSRNPILMPGYAGEVYPFRYVTIQNYKERLAPDAVRRKIIFYPFNSEASDFASSDTILNQVWDLCKYSVKATSFTGYYVDGDRERIPYEADALINQLSHYAVDAEYSMARRTMDYLLYHPTWPTEWSLQNILIAWNDYMYTGDDGLIKKYYPQLQKKLLMELAGPNGLISTRTNKQTDEFLASIHMSGKFDGRRGLHDNVDWPQTGDFIGSEKEYGGETDGFVYQTYNPVINAFYYRNLILIRQIAAVLKRTDDEIFYTQKAKEVYHSFQNVFRDEETSLIRDGDSTTHSSLHANMFALAFGLIRPADREKVLTFIKSRRMACSVYGAQFLLDALYEAGEDQYALELMTSTAQRSWYNMIRSGSTITMEAWDKVYKPNLDLNHAWGAAPANIIVRHLVGIQPLSPGFETFQVKPQIGRLTSVSLITPTIKGPVLVKYNKSKRADQMEIQIPGGATANIYIQYSPEKPNLLLNGKPTAASLKNGFFILKNIPAGKHTIIAN
ncbi:alpha-L-rhamnosidase-related protein [Dyadobacter helix]|nr:alpha-L-rhamnosidase C-terminal domain-containing protein [Dyadobacter sp. CECT 9275]